MASSPPTPDHVAEKAPGPTVDLAGVGLSYAEFEADFRAKLEQRVAELLAGVEPQPWNDRGYFRP